MSSFQTILDLSPIPHLKYIRGYGFVPASPSSVSTALLCGNQYRHKYGIGVEKLPFVQGDAAKYGEWVHKEVEDYFLEDEPIDKDVFIECPSVMKRVRFYEGLIDKSVAYSPEIKLAANADGISAWHERSIGAIADLNIDVSPEHRWIIDWKTNHPTNAAGKYRSPSPKPFQLEMLALMSFIESEELQRVTGVFEFLKYEKYYTYEFYRDRWTYDVINPQGKVTEKDFLYPLYTQRYWSLQEQKRFSPRHNPLCLAYCDVESCENYQVKWSRN